VVTVSTNGHFTSLEKGDTPATGGIPIAGCQVGPAVNLGDQDGAPLSGASAFRTGLSSLWKGNQRAELQEGSLGGINVMPISAAQ
jgi:hypothetical protein